MRETRPSLSRPLSSAPIVRVIAGVVGIILTLATPSAFAQIPDAVAQAEQQRIAAIARAIPAAISIFTPDGNGGGSGVVITRDGYALSNYHVTSPVGEYMKCGMSDGRLYDAVIVGIDPTGDVALIKLLGRIDFPHAEIADSDQVAVGDWCFAVGNPFLLATDLQPTVTYGIVSGVHRYQYPAGSILEYADCIQTDAAINPGNSGGPLFDAQGELIGVVGRGSFEKRGRVNVGVGYAISINQIKNFLGSLHSGRIVDHATLGATVTHDESGRVLVSNILESSDAYLRGLRYGDEIVSFGGRTISSVNAFKNVLGIFPRGWRVPLSFRRDGQRQDVFVRLDGVHTQAQLLALLEREQPPEEVPEGDGKRPGKKPKPTPPRPKKEPAEKVEIPAEAAKLIQKKAGFKNFYFNELHRTRVWNAFTKHGDFTSLASQPWQVRGKLATGDEFTATLGSEESVLQLPSGQAVVTETKDLNAREQLEPGDTGLLLALHQWRRLLTTGPGKFGEVIYQGTAPLPGRDGLYDVLSATRNVTESLVYFDPTESRLIASEIFPDAGADPCELLFEEYRSVDGRELPHLILARRGAEVYAELRITSYQFSRANEK